MRSSCDGSSVTLVYEPFELSDEASDGLFASRLR